MAGVAGGRSLPTERIQPHAVYQVSGIDAASWSAAGLSRLHGVLDPVTLDRLSFLGVLPVPALWLALALVVRGSPLATRAPWGLCLLLLPGAICYGLLLQGPDLAASFVSSGPPG